MKQDPTFSAPVGTVKDADGLTLAQRRFVEAYVETMNASEAARRAGYSKKTAGFQGSALLKRPQIRAAIEQLVFERASVTRSLLIEELTSVAMSNAQDFFSWEQIEDVQEILDDGTVVVRQRAAVQLRPSRELSRRTLSAVKSITEKTGENGARKVELALHDKLKAVELLGRALNLFPKDGESNVITINNAPIGSVSVSYVDPALDEHGQPIVGAPPVPCNPFVRGKVREDDNDR